MKKELDEIDRQIIKYKRERFRPSLIARTLGLKPASVSYRIKFMKEKFGIKFYDEDLDDIDKVIIDCKNKGISNTIIARNLGISDSNVSNRVRRIEDQTGTKFPHKKSSLMLKDELVHEELLNGLSNHEIAKKLGMSETEVSRRKKKIEQILSVEFPLQKIDEKDEMILKLKEENLSDRKIGEKIGMSSQSVGKRLQKIDKVSKREIAKGIMNLVFTKHATVEQIKEIGEYYGVDMEEILNSIEEQER